MSNSAMINLKTLAAVSLGISKEAARYYLNGALVEITTRATVYVTTDGHRMFVCRDELKEGTEDNTLLGSFIIPATSCKALKVGRFDETHAVLTGSAEGLTLTHNGTSHGFKPIDGVYPDWRRVIPNATSTPDADNAVSYNFGYLADFSKYAKLMDLGKPHLVRNGNGPAFVWFGENTETFGVIMPMKSYDMQGRKQPDWVSPVVVPERKAA